MRPFVYPVSTDEQLNLACGHAASPHGPHTSGTALVRAINEHVCAECADKMQIEDLKHLSRVSAYLSSDGQTITTWTGTTLGRVTYSRVRRNSGFALGTRVNVHMSDLHGRRWYGSGPGPGMYVNLRAFKGGV